MKFFNAFTHSIVAGSLLVACQVVASPLDQATTSIATINEILAKIEQRPTRANDELVLKVKNGRLQLFSNNERINENVWSFEFYRLGPIPPAVPALGWRNGLEAFEKTATTTVGDLKKALTDFEAKNVEISDVKGKVKLKSTVKMPSGKKSATPIVHASTLLALLNSLDLADDQPLQIDAEPTRMQDDVFFFALPREEGASGTVYGMNYYRQSEKN